MKLKQKVLLALVFGFICFQSLRVEAAESQATISAAQKEGKLIIYSSTDSASVEPLLQDFKTLYPFLQVEYNDINTTEIYNRFLAESASGAGTADFLWSSAMDLQLQLASKGNALTYASPEISGLPKWAVWQNQAYGTTFEPVSITYNKRLLPADAVPQSHADMIRLIKEKPDLFKEKIATFDPEKSGVGFLMMTQDAKVFPQFWDLAKALGSQRRQGLHQHRRDAGKGRFRRALPWLQHYRLLCSSAPEERIHLGFGFAQGLHPGVFARRLYL